jgi:hypothetical protein
MPDGSIVVMGGATNGSSGYKNDVWRSMDNGVTWAQVNASAGWSARNDHSSVMMPDGSIVLIGGDATDSSYKNDVWRSTDNGVTWAQVNASAGWSGRRYLSCVAMPDGSIVLTGGQANDGFKNDVWHFVPIGLSVQNPSHTYTTTGRYTVSLTATNAGGLNTTTRIDYILVNQGGGGPQLIIPNASLYQNTAPQIPIRLMNMTGGTGISFNLTMLEMRQRLDITLFRK